MTNDSRIAAFTFKDCAVAAITAALRQPPRRVPCAAQLGCLYCYFRCGLPCPHCDDPGYNIDCAPRRHPGGHLTLMTGLQHGALDRAGLG